MSRAKSNGGVARPESEEISREYLDMLAQLPPKKPPALSLRQRRKGTGSIGKPSRPTSLQ